MISCCRMSALLLAAAVITLVLTSSQAKRGCASFGHSCFGGHGKRSDVPPDNGAQLNNFLNLDPMDYQALHLFRQLCTLQPDQYVRMAPVFRRLAESYKVEAEEPLPRK